MSRLESIRLKGFKSIADAEILLGDVNVCIGANGAGKSNLIAFLWLLGYLVAGDLRNYVRQRGGAKVFLRHGPQHTAEIKFELCFLNDGGSRSHYAATLAGSSDDLLFFAYEAVAYQARAQDPISWETIGQGGHLQTALTEQPGKTAQTIAGYLQRLKTYHFHDTSPTARLRGAWQLRENKYIRADGSNLAAYLRRLREQEPDFYRQVLLTVQQLAPFIRDFDLTPEDTGPPSRPRGDQEVSLTWFAYTKDNLMSPLQLSDGTLRSIALIATLLRPESELPLIMAFDEPELGLHPFALEVLVSLVERLRGTRQLILATQSTFLVDRFEPEDIIVVSETELEGSRFSRLHAEDLAPWLEAYSLGELWQKNVLGGRP
jgi:predicted ATPase